MNVNLLYKDREWINPEYYYDEKSIAGDLGLDTLFLNASKPVIYRNDEVEKIGDSDSFIKNVFYRVMLTPLRSSDELIYRQDIIKDAIANEAFTISLYETVSSMLDEWERLGRHVNSKNTGRDSNSKLITRIQEFCLFYKTLKEMKALFKENEANLKSEGLKYFYERFTKTFSDELEEDLGVIEKAIEYYINTGDEVKQTVRAPRFVLNAKIGAGCKFDDFSLMEAETVERKYRDPKSAISKVKDYIDSLTPDSVAAFGEINAERQAAKLSFEVAAYLMAYTEPFMSEFENFFDKFKFQIAFYRGNINLHHHFKRFHVGYSYPVVSKKDTLVFTELKEIVMAIEQRIDAVGNSCNISPKNLIIITGANQGGKSTFLRSIGIAQVMMQCGMMVPAEHYESGLFPSLFMHFTRREDSEMNSGRLDEELKRMSLIIDNLGPDSLILLNESFATTTEKDGSEIAYGIIKALSESGVKIITVTHLLSFAKRIYAESLEAENAGKESGISFFSAERLEDGKRTYKMVASVPKLTSFGLDLYDQIIGSKTV